jgi:hypothetical protein
MRNRNWDRPVLRLRGRSTEDINGADVPREFRTAPRPQRSKADMRREADQAVQAVTPKQPVDGPPQPDQPPAPASDEAPPWV